MTVPFPLDAFDEGRPLRPRRKPLNVDTDKLVGIGITIAVHAVILALALTAVHVTHTKVLQELSVQITPEKRQVVEDIKPLPKMAVPSVITVPPPEFTVRTVTPPPVTAQPPIANPAPPVSVAVPSKAAGETRDSYLGRLLAQLNRFKQYPRAARQAHIEGVVMLHFVMDADGKVQSFEIAKSSGRPVLDAEALALIQRAQPLPALPPDFPTRTLDAVVPVEFSLRG
ncbi:MAG TPA: energy transducer TonB [Rhizomicrobium sp.]|jgi:protein TonB|nr:energy transducer TonB [Rhizomicrobium sp.]